ncbi:MAG: S8 family peptidase [Chloroflexi bacterium]|nr:S8 family peptidase [Chloroflexota bacterium]
MRSRWHRLAAWILSLALVVAVAGIPPVQADGGGGFSSPPGGAGRRIVTFDRSYAVGQIAWRSAISTAGASVIKALPIVNGMVVTVPSAEAERAIRRLPGVAAVRPDVAIRIPSVGAAVAAIQQVGDFVPAGVSRIGATEVWATTRGDGVRVAILDTGVDRSHPDLADNVRGGYLAIRTGPYAGLGADAWDDDNGHGTLVAGVVAAADNGFGIAGVAPGAEIYAVKVMDSIGIGFISDIIDGIAWAIDNQMQVVNMSFGVGVDIPELQEAMLAAYTAGITLVAAAGNTGPDNALLDFPGQYLETIAVGAVDAGDHVARFSARGEKLEMVAPGVDVVSTALGGGYALASGTSLAAPHVAGAAALLLGARGPLSPNAVKTILVLTVEDIAEEPFGMGWGLVNARAVVP